MCPLVFSVNPEVPKRQLGSVEILRLIINGERAEDNAPPLDRQGLICDPCFHSKMYTVSLMWKNLNLHLQDETVRLNNEVIPTHCVICGQISCSFIVQV